MRNVVRVLFFLILTFYCVLSYSEQVNVYVLNTGDIHESSKYLKKIKSYVDITRTNHPGCVILLDAGDMLTQFPFSKYVSPQDRKTRDLASTTPKGEKMLEWASTMKYDAILIGNHDMIAGANILQKLLNRYNLPLIAANLSHPSLYLSRYKIVQLNFRLKTGKAVSIRVGIIGISDQDQKDYHFPNKADKEKLKTYPVYNPTINKIIDEVAKQSDFIILLSHNWDNVDRDSVSALKSNKICAIIGGHSHKLLNEKDNGKTLIKSGVHGSNVGCTKITWDSDAHKVLTVTAENKPMKEE
ncbi:MAG TPA: hypothetical protein DD381_10510 [Lentisphaeria bacterium]|nr:MAG: hypothetical protein A2X47_02160 [Lentisphaerae bacterium GWF2_38_69]HBM16758.1 hypothetical protein [Lentisphaeria bacterium]